MLQFLSSIFGTIFGFLESLFPASPFQDLVSATEGMTAGIGWLNWAFPVGEAMTVFVLWIGICFAVAAGRLLYNRMNGIADNIMNKQGGV